MSELAIGSRNKRRFGIYLTLSVAISFWIFDVELVDLDWTVVLTGTIVPITGATLFLTAIFYELRADNIVNYLFRYLAPRIPYSYPSDWGGIENLSAPWFKPTDEIQYSSIISTFDEKYVNDAIWEAKVSIFTGTAIFIALLRYYAFYELQFVLLGTSAGVLVILVSLYRLYSTAKRSDYLRKHRFVIDVSREAVARLKGFQDLDPEQKAVLGWLDGIVDEFGDLTAGLGEENWLHFVSRFTLMESRIKDLLEIRRAQFGNTP